MLNLIKLNCVGKIQDRQYTPGSFNKPNSQILQWEINRKMLVIEMKSGGHANQLLKYIK